MPRQWKVSVADGGIISVNGDTPQAVICLSPCWGKDTPAELDFWVQHAQLIAASPDLLEECANISRRCPDGVLPDLDRVEVVLDGRTINTLRAAIAKAEGMS